MALEIEGSNPFAHPNPSPLTTTAPRRSLLAVVAHPDDETFMFGGTLARYAAEGVEVHVIVGCLDDRVDGAARREELRRACETLGVAGTTVLDYVTPQQPGDLSVGRARSVAARLQEHIGRIDPGVVVSFDPTGGTGEPDHVLMGRATALAFGSESAEGGPGPGPRRLYAGHFGRRLMRAGVAALRVAPGRDPRRFGPGGAVDLVAALEAAPPPTTFIDVRPHLEVRRRAALCHASQLRSAPWFLRRYELLPPRLRGLLFPQEVYTRIRPSAPPALRETGFFGEG